MTKIFSNYPPQTLQHCIPSASRKLAYPQRCIVYGVKAPLLGLEPQRLLDLRLGLLCWKVFGQERFAVVAIPEGGEGNGEEEEKGEEEDPGCISGHIGSSSASMR